MSPDSLLITPSLGATLVEASTQARVTAAKLLETSKLVTVIEDRLDADSATLTMQENKPFLDMVEEQRVAAKAPALDIGRKIDALAKDLTAALTVEQNRIGRLVGNFEAAERKKAADAQAAADKKAAKIAFDAAQAERKAMAAAPTAEAAGRAYGAIVHQAEVDIKAARSLAVPAPRAAGTQVRGTVKFEVTDIKALFAARPEMVALEANGPVIRALITADPTLVVPGLRHWIENKLSV